MEAKCDKLVDSFNKKYEAYLEPNHYGLDIANEKVVSFLDNIFSTRLILIPNFQYSQIKIKFGYCCFYCNLAKIKGKEGEEMRDFIENKVDDILRT